MTTQLKLMTLVLGIVAVLAFGGSSVQAQTASDTTATTAADAPVESSITLVAKGSLTDASGNVTVQGNLPVLVKRVVDTTSVTSPSLVLLDIDFSQLTGTTGSGKTLKTFVTGGNHASEIRPLQASDQIIIPVPYYDSSKDALSARTMLVSITLNYDVSSGKVTGGSATVGNNVVTANSVGTIQTAPIQ